MKSLKAALEKRLPKSGFARAVGVLAGGTAVSQAITIAAIPLLTRLYTPDDFTVLAIYASLLGMISVIACMRLEIAIPLPEDDAEAFNLLKLSIFSALAISALTAIAVFTAGDLLLEKIGRAALKPYIWLLPFGVLLSGIYLAVQYWATRAKNFTGISKTKMTQVLGGTGVQLGLGVWGKLGPLGLLLGHALMSGLGILSLAKHGAKDFKRLVSTESKPKLAETFKKYEKFPKYSMLEAFANVAAIQLPILIIGVMAIGPEAGYLMLAMKASALPLGLIGGSISQVYLSKAPEELRANNLAPFTAQIIAKLVQLGVGPIIAIGILAPSVMGLVLGKEWQRTGEIILMLTPWFVMQFVSSPVSMALHVTGNQRLAMLNQVMGLALRVGGTLLAAYCVKEKIVLAYAVSGLLSYSIYFLAILHVARIKWAMIFGILGCPVIWVMYWGGAALLLNQILNISKAIF